MNSYRKLVTAPLLCVKLSAIALEVPKKNTQMARNFAEYFASYTVAKMKFEKKQNFSTLGLCDLPLVQYLHLFHKKF